MDNKEINLLKILSILLKYKKLVIISTVIVSIASVIYIMLVPLKWTSNTTFVSIEEETGMSFASSSLLGLTSSFLGSGQSATAMNLISVMRSRTFTEDIVEHFGLIELLKLSYPDSLLNMEKAVNIVKENITEISLNDETGIINISITTGDKYLSAKIANYYFFKISKYNLENRMSKGKQKRIFLENRITEVSNKINLKAEELRKFTEDNNAISLENQIQALIENYSNLIAAKTELEIEYELVKNNFGIKSPQAEMVKQNIEIIEKKVNEYEVTRVSDDSRYLLSLEDIPSLTKKYAEIFLQLEIEQKIYEFLYPQYESAKIEEIKDIPTLEVIDIAIPAGQRTSPRRGIFCIVTFFISFFAFSLLAFAIEKWDSMKKNELLKSQFDELTNQLKK